MYFGLELLYNYEEISLVLQNSHGGLKASQRGVVTMVLEFVLKKVGIDRSC